MKKTRLVIPAQEIYLTAGTEKLHHLLGHRGDGLLGEFFYLLQIAEMKAVPYQGEELTLLESSFLEYYYEKVDGFDCSTYTNVRLTPKLAEFAGAALAETVEYRYRTGEIEVNGRITTIMAVVGG